MQGELEEDRAGSIFFSSYSPATAGNCQIIIVVVALFHTDGCRTVVSSNIIFQLFQSLAMTGSTGSSIPGQGLHDAPSMAHDL